MGYAISQIGRVFTINESELTSLARSLGVDDEDIRHTEYVLLNEQGEGQYPKLFLSDSPPFAPLAAVKEAKIDPFGYWYGENRGILMDEKYVSGWFYAGENRMKDTGRMWNMEHFGDEIDSVINDLAEIFCEDLKDNSDDTEVVAKPPVLQEGQKFFSDIFGWTPDFGDFPVKVYAEEDRPDLDPYWVWPKQETEEAVWSLENRMPVRLIGLAGTGKSMFAENLAAITGRAFCRINLSGEVFLGDLIGEKELVDGETKFIEGDLPKYVRRPSVILLDEVTAAKPGVYMAFLQRFLEKFILKIQATGTEIPGHEGMYVVGADNALGLGDNRSKFPTRNVQDTSTLNRWPCTITVGYMEPSVFAKVVKVNVPSLHKGQCEKLARFASLCQNAYAKGDLPLVFSLRQAIPIAKMAVGFNDMRRAIKLAFVNSFADEQHKAAIEGWIASIW